MPSSLSRCGRLPPGLHEGLELPLVVAPMFLVSGIDLVAAACLNGAIGAFPSLNARTPEILENWLSDLSARFEAAASSGRRPASWAVNLVMHSTNVAQILDEAIDFTACAPTMLIRLAEHHSVASRRDLGRLRSMSSGSAACRRMVRLYRERFGVEIFNWRFATSLPRREG